MTSVKNMSPSELREFLEDPENIGLIPDDELDAVLAMLNIDGDHALRTIEDAISTELSRDHLKVPTSSEALSHGTVQTCSAPVHECSSDVNIFCSASNAVPFGSWMPVDGTDRLRLPLNICCGTVIADQQPNSCLSAITTMCRGKAFATCPRHMPSTVRSFVQRRPS